MRRTLRPPFGRRHAGQKSQPPGYRYRTAGYDQLQVIYVSRGKLFFTSGGRARALEPGWLALLREGSAFGLHTGRLGYGGVYFVAAGEGRPEFRGAAVALAADPGTRQLAAMMEQEITFPGAGSGEVLGSLGRALAWRAIRLSAGGGPAEGARDWAERARAALEATLTTGRGAREVLASLGLSYRQLSRCFTEVYGLSPKRYQLGARIREAQGLLAATRQPVTAVAFELGYPSSQHFATRFRAATGLTPSQWRAGKRRRRPAPA